jgi:hypothetical protein
VFELAPCPLCNSVQVQLCRDYNNQEKDFCRCRHCKCTGPFKLWQARLTEGADRASAEDTQAPRIS